MEKNWTPEPWHITPREMPQYPIIHIDTDEWTIAAIYEHMGEAEQEANAVRIATCVNGCADIPNPKGMGAGIEKLKTMCYVGPDGSRILNGGAQDMIKAALRDFGIEVK